MARLSFLCLALALLFAAVVAQDAVVVPKPADQVCLSDQDCTSILATCCDTVCQYVAANLTASRALVTVKSDTCTKFTGTCPTLNAPCTVPKISCIMQAPGVTGAATGICTVVTQTSEPSPVPTQTTTEPSPIPSPVAPTCTAFDNACTWSCGTQEQATAAANANGGTACKPSGLVGCKNSCLQKFAQCSMSATAGCGFVALNNSLEVCNRACDAEWAPTPSPVAPTCVAFSNSCVYTCGNQAEATAAAGSNAQCMPSVVQHCKNTCYQSFSTCGTTAAGGVGCTFTAINNSLTTCLRVCDTPTEVPTPTPTPAPAVCGTLVSSGCLNTCQLLDTRSVNATCTSTIAADVACKNKCTLAAKCAATAGLDNTASCAYQGTGYGDCIKACETATIVPTPSPVATSPVTTSPVATTTCQGFLNTCVYVCGTSSQAVAAEGSSLTCRPTATVGCKNSCYERFAKCSSTASLNGAAGSTCSFSAINASLETCLRVCDTPTPVPTPSVVVNPIVPCSVWVTSECTNNCLSSSLRMMNVTSCGTEITVSSTAQCLNKCTLTAKCSADANGACAYTGTGYADCVKACTAAPVCQAFSSSCQWTCGTPAQATGAADSNLVCKPSALAACKNTCLQTWATCGVTAGTVSSCSFTASDSTALAVCNRECEATYNQIPTPVPSPTTPPAPTCTAFTNAGCEYACASSDFAASQPDSSLTCKPSANTGCKNQCKVNYARCSFTSNTASTCGFLAVDALFDTCIKECDAKFPPVVDVPTCAVSQDANNDCKNVCGTAQLSATANGVALECAPRNADTQCINRCNVEFATCSAVNGQCSYIYRNTSAYLTCTSACTATVPTPATCSIFNDAKCQQSCLDSRIAMPTYACTGATAVDAVVTCRNKCAATAKCSVLSSGCGFVGTGYADCVAKCDVPVNPPSTLTCVTSGCYGDICSATAIRPLTCEATTPCKAKCLATSTCTAVSVDKCDWSLSQTTIDCLAKCTDVVPPPPANPTCVPGGCPSNPTCLPSTLRATTANVVSNDTINCPDVVPSCETRCLAYAQCSVLPTLVATDVAQCGWTANSASPSQYGDCLAKCKVENAGCFASSCGTECLSYFKQEVCPATLAAPDCATRCKLAYSKCGLTKGACSFSVVDGYDKCLDSCTVKPPVSTCPNGAAPYNCLVNPCDVTKCPAYPSATCTADYCGGCNAIFKVDGRVVNCDNCASLPCDKCVATAGCGFCSGSFVDGATGTAKPVGACVSDRTAATCLANNVDVVSSASGKCPTTASTSTTEVRDVAPLQDQVVAAAPKSSVLSRFSLIITMVIKETSTDSVNKDNLIKMFVDVIGDGSPSTTDRVEICDVLKAALVKTETTIDASALKCQLDDKVSAKRDAGMIASLTYPGTTATSSASFATASIAAVVLAAVALLF